MVLGQCKRRALLWDLFVTLQPRESAPILHYIIVTITWAMFKGEQDAIGWNNLCTYILLGSSSLLFGVEAPDASLGVWFTSLQKPRLWCLHQTTQHVWCVSTSTGYGLSGYGTTIFNMGPSMNWLQTEENRPFTFVSKWRKIQNSRGSNAKKLFKIVWPGRSSVLKTGGKESNPQHTWVHWQSSQCSRPKFPRIFSPSLPPQSF